MKPTVGAAAIAAESLAAGLNGAAPRPPPRPPRPAAARPPAGGTVVEAGAAESGGGADIAARSGVRSVSVDQRNNSIVSEGAAPAPTTVARIVNAGSPAKVGPAATASMTATAAAPPTNMILRLLPVAVIRAFRTAQPLDQPFQFRVFQPGAALAHVQRHHAPAFGAEARGVDAIDRVAGRARPLQQTLALDVGKEGRDLLRHIGAREGLSRRAESLRQPVEQNRPLLLRKRHIQAAMLGGEMNVPRGAVERVVGVVVYAVTRRAVLEDDLPRRPLRRRDLWSRR